LGDAIKVMLSFRDARHQVLHLPDVGLQRGLRHLRRRTVGHRAVGFAVPIFEAVPDVGVI